MFRFLTRQPMPVAFGESLALLILISWLDLATGHQVSLVLFYSVPIVFAVWLCDSKSAFAVAGLFADGETVVQDADCIRESYPGFEIALDDFINSKRTRATTPVIGSLSPARIDEE